MRKLPLIITAIMLLAPQGGCAPRAASETPENMPVDNGRSSGDAGYDTLTITIDGWASRGRDALLTIDPIDGEFGGIEDEAIEFPHSMEIPIAGEAPRISVTARSLASEGDVSCEASYRNVTIHNWAGFYKVQCFGLMSLESPLERG